MLKKLRVAIAAIFFICITLLFLDFTGTLHAWLGWMAKIQFIPAVLALNLAIIVLLVVLTLVFGRVYCSVICPLGIFQDIVSWINGKRGKKQKNRFSYSPAKSWLRYTFLAIFIVALVAGVGSLAALLDPYASYGRIASNLFAPLWQLGNNFLAWIAERVDSYAFYSTDDIHHSRCHLYYNSGTRMARRQDILQHRMPCRHSSGVPLPLRHVPPCNQCGQMPQLQPVLARMQGIMHRL